ncbi:uncharacterized protein TNCV_3597261 [Trichonephila clavipes]|nr:uncharacterized protein TNCV_3597261 [Trichonephila clavipes]
MGCLRTCHLSESYLDVSRVPYHANCTRRILSQSLHQLGEFPVDMLGPWIHEVVSIPVHVHQLNSTGNETRQTRQRVSSHRQSNVDDDGPRRGVEQRCRRFDVFPDSRYSRYTRAIVVLENPNFIATSEMLCPISRVPTITPRSNSLKS